MIHGFVFHIIDYVLFITSKKINNFFEREMLFLQCYVTLETEQTHVHARV